MSASLSWSLEKFDMSKTTIGNSMVYTVEHELSDEVMADRVGLLEKVSNTYKNIKKDREKADAERIRKSKEPPGMGVKIGSWVFLGITIFSLGTMAIVFAYLMWPLFIIVGIFVGINYLFVKKNK